MTTGSILVVDDNPANLSVLTAYLETNGYEVLIARTGESGLEKAEYAQPELILLDYVLPGINGFEVCKKLKENPNTQKIPVIFMTSLSDNEHKIQGLRLGAVDYLTKPLQQEEVLLRVNTHIQLSRLTHQLESEVVERTRNLQEEISERRRVQEKLIYHAMLLEEISDAVISTNNQFFIQSWNHAAETLYGWTEEEALGKNLQDLLRSSYPSISRTEFLKNLVDTHYFQGEVIHSHKGGATIPIWTSIKALLNDSGETYAYIAINRDVSPHKNAEEQRLQVARLQERSDVLNNLLGTVSHDLRTPLAIIETNLYLLDRLLESDKAREKTKAIRKQTGHLKKLIDDLLTLSRLDHQAQLNVSPIQLNQLLKDIASSLDGTLSQREQALSLSLEDLPVIEGNESELYRALINLVENAINYTPNGGLIQLKSGQEDGQLWVEVIDNGIGIKEDELPHIFERYYRADKARNINTGGSGLGLAIVKRIIDMHNGHIEVYSKINQGTRFHLSLPTRGLPS